MSLHANTDINLPVSLINKYKTNIIHAQALNCQYLKYRLKDFILEYHILDMNNKYYLYNGILVYILNYYSDTILSKHFEYLFKNMKFFNTN